jgi:enoyl-CoA hydratase/carnithine racemase
MAHVRVEVSAPVMGITLSNPKRRNAQTPGTWRELAHIGESLPAEVRFVVVNAEGPSFSAGLDLAMMSPEGAEGERSMLSLPQESDEDLQGFISQAQAGFTWLQDCSAITLAAVQGHAIGAGMQLALACDRIIAAPDAQFAMRETSLGLVPDLAGTKPLVERIGYARALDICATGRFVGAEEGYRIGLIDEIAEDPTKSAHTWTEQFAHTPEGALRALKLLLRSAADSEPSAQRAHERLAQIARLRALHA